MSRRAGSLCLAAALAAAGFLGWSVLDRAAPEVCLVEEAEGAAGAAAEEESGPTLAARRPEDIDARLAGESAIVGHVLRGGRPEVARVEAYLASRPREFEPLGWSDPRSRSRCMEPLPDVRPLRIATAGADGAFRLSRLPRGIINLVAVASDGARGATLVSLTARGTVEADVAVLAGPHTLVGRILDREGRPWRGQVRACLEWDDDRCRIGPLPGDATPVSTDVEGRFALRGLAPGEYVLHAEIPGVVRFITGHLWIPREGVFEWVVDKDARSVSGHVLSDEDGSPIAGAVVTADARFGFARGEADPAGRFEILLDATRSTVLYVRAPGWSPGRLVVGFYVEEPVVLMSRAGRVVGRVTSKADGTPVAGVTVLAESNWRLGGERVGGSAVTESDGRFAIDDLPAVTATLSVRGLGYVLSRVGSVGASPTVRRGATVAATLVVEKGATAAGRVIDADGRGVASARVEAFSGSSAGKGQAPISATIADAEGRFTVDGLTPDTEHTIRASASGFIGATSKIERAIADLPEVEIRLSRIANITVRVAGDEGKPLAGAEVWGAGGDGTWSYATTNAEGVALLSRVSGSRPRISVEAGGYLAFRGDAGIADASGAIPPLDVRLERPQRIAGFVRYVDARPASGLSVRMTPGDTSTRVGPDGAFAFEALAPGTVTLAVNDAARAQLRQDWSDVESSYVRVEVRTGEVDVRIVMPWPGPLNVSEEAPPEGIVRVRVVDPEGRPVPAAKVTYQQGSQEHEANVEGGWGEIPRSSTRISAGAARSASGARLPLGTASYAGTIEGAEQIEIRLPRGLRTAGTVFDPDGRPVSDVDVAVRATGVGASDDTTSDDRGAFSFDALEDGDYTLAASSPRVEWLAASATTRAGDVGTALRFRAANRATVTVLDPSGAPVSGARIHLYRQYAMGDGRTGTSYASSFNTGDSGRAELSALDPEIAYTLRASARLDDRGWATVWLGEWKQTDVTLRFAPAWTIRGTVADPAGRPLPSVDVLAVPETDRGSYTATTGNDGSFQILGLPAGRYRVRAGASEPDSEEDEELVFGASRELIAGPESATIVADAGAEGVRLTLDPGEAVLVRIEGLTGDPAKTTVQLFEIRPAEGAAGRTSTDAGRAVARRSPSRAGLVVFPHGARDARYALWVGSPASGRCAFVEGVRPGATPTVVRLERGEALSGRLHSAIPAADYTVLAVRLGVSVTARCDATGAFEFPVLSSGRWHIVARATAANEAKPEGEEPTALEAVADASPGTTIDLTLSPRR